MPALKKKLQIDQDEIPRFSLSLDDLIDNIEEVELYEPVKQIKKKSQSEATKKPSSITNKNAESKKVPLQNKTNNTTSKSTKPIKDIPASKTDKTVTKNKEPQSTSQDADIDSNLELVDNGPWFRCKETEDYVLIPNPKLQDKNQKKMKNFKLPAALYKYLLPHQREGIVWMWDLHQRGNKSGGILGDDMGLGKTIQTITFMIGLFRSRMMTRALLVIPVSTIENWRKELEQWNKEFRVKFYHGTSKVQRTKDLDVVQRKGGICITTYGMVSSNAEQIAGEEEPVLWDYVILDEGHKIKTPSRKISKAIRVIQSKHRILLSGTPIQNNLREMWALFDYTSQGTLLGDQKTFQIEFEEKILRASDRAATTQDKKIGAAIIQQLREIISPYFLRREKKEVFQNQDIPNSMKNAKKKKSQDDEDDEDGSDDIEEATPVDNSNKMMLTTRKNDFIVWLKIAKPQLQLYRNFLETDEVKDVLNQTNSPLAAITVLKKICDHPLLLNHQMKTCQSLDLTMEDLDNDEPQSSSDDITSHSLESIVAQSGKMQFLEKLLANLKREGHRVLIFSQSVKMLNIIEVLLNAFDYKFLRIDGSVLSPKERQRRIDLFNQDNRYFCFILTTAVGGLGINLTGADRAVIFDPSWTTTDDQAVDRVYRIGQKKNVVVYRLITSGTIEEKIYRKQVFKGSLLKNVIQQNQKHHRYFTKQELCELFVLDDITVSTTQKQLEELHSHQRKTDKTLDKHLEFLHSLGIVGISDHDLLFTETTDREKSDNTCRQQAKEAKKRLQNTVSASDTAKNQPIDLSTPKKPTNKRRMNRKTSDSSSGSSIETINLDDDEVTMVDDQNIDHENADGEHTLQVHHPISTLNDESKQLYNDLIQRINNSKDDPLAVLELCMVALDICDEDPTLHIRTLQAAASCHML